MASLTRRERAILEKKLKNFSISGDGIFGTIENFLWKNLKEGLEIFQPAIN